MGRCDFVVWLLLACLVGDSLSQYREKNISGAETDAVQAILARYLQRRLQGSQLSTPPPPAVLFSNNNQARVRQAAQRTTSNALPRNASEKQRQEHVEDYEDYEDDLEGFEDSERSRTRFDLFAVGLVIVPFSAIRSPRFVATHFRLERKFLPTSELPQPWQFPQPGSRSSNTQLPSGFPRLGTSKTKDSSFRWPIADPRDIPRWLAVRGCSRAYPREILLAHVRDRLHSLSASAGRSIDPGILRATRRAAWDRRGLHVVLLFRSDDATAGLRSLWWPWSGSNWKDDTEGSGIDMSWLILLVTVLVGSLEAVPGRLNDDCPNCVDEHSSSLAAARWTMPLLKLGEKRYYLGIFFKANWYRASQYCRYHGMHLASIASQEENDRLEKHIKDFGLGHEHFWTSGTDQAEEGTFFWMANGRPITFENWNVGEPNNFRYENGEEEHCLELWNRDGKGLKWNDSPCSFETFFVCEVQ